ncbi:MAG: hypothetical protein P8188_16375 [Gemmatimonadota bacterium]
MKLILLLYLADDENCVARLLKERGVLTHSRLNLEGFGRGMTGWYGDTPTYRSRMAFALVPEGQAETLMDGVRSCHETIGGSQHPIHAIQLGVEAMADSGGPFPAA